MRVVVDFDLCESNALCVGLAPSVFSMDDDNFLLVEEDEIDEDLVPDVEEAVHACPRQAISIAE